MPQETQGLTGEAGSQGSLRYSEAGPSRFVSERGERLVHFAVARSGHSAGCALPSRQPEGEAVTSSSRPVMLSLAFPCSRPGRRTDTSSRAAAGDHAELWVHGWACAGLAPLRHAFAFACRGQRGHRVRVTSAPKELRVCEPFRRGLSSFLGQSATRDGSAWRGRVVGPRTRLGPRSPGSLFFC